MTFGERLTAAMQHAGASRKELADELGISVQAIGDVIKGKTKSLTAENAVVAAKFLKVNPMWLAANQGAMFDDVYINTAPAEIGSRRIPLISYIQAGHWSEIVDNFQFGDAEEWIYTDVQHSSEAFALEIKGTSMEPDFREGDRVVIDPAVAPKPGDCVAAVNGRTEQSERKATFKKYRPRSIDAAGNVIFELVPLNEDYPTLRSDKQQIEIVGTMVEHRRYFKRAPSLG